MNRILDFIFNSKTPTREDILNQGLKLALKWGQEWLSPIQQRLSKKFTFLTQTELDEYNTICKETMNSGFEYIRVRLEKVSDNKDKIAEAELKSDFNKYMLDNYPWVNKDNLKMVFTQGLYYSWKDGLSGCLK